MDMDGLLALRREIDDADTQMRALFLRRMALAADAARLKAEAGQPLRDVPREQALLAQNLAFVQREVQDDALRDLYGEFLTHLLGLSRRHQLDVLAAEGGPTAGGGPDAEGA